MLLFAGDTVFFGWGFVVGGMSRMSEAVVFCCVVLTVVPA